VAFIPNATLPVQGVALNDSEGKVIGLSDVSLSSVALRI
jgi:hypothetical protein